MIISLSYESKIKRKIKELTFSAAAELKVLDIFIKNQLNSFLKATIVRVSWESQVINVTFNINLVLDFENL